MKGWVKRPSFRMPGAPVTSYLTLAFLVTVLVLIAVDYPTGTFTIGIFVVIGIPALVAGWYGSRKKIAEIAAAREGYTGNSPVIAGNRAVDAKIARNEEEARRRGDS